MNILTFIETQYPIKSKVRDRLVDPYKRVAEMDNLPYDKIGPDEDGRVTKLVEVEEGRFIPVIELVAMTKEEIDESTDIALKLVWEAYMENIDINDVNFTDIMECVRAYRSNSAKRKGQLDVLSV